MGMEGRKLSHPQVEEARQLYRKGLQAESDGDLQHARTFMLQAAEILLLAAREARGNLREVRKQQAEKLLDEAAALEKLPKGFTPTLAGKKSPLAVGKDEEASEWMVAERPEVSFDDVAGLQEVKQQIRMRLLYPFTHPELAEQYDIQPGGGILLYGPPGTGKTMIARAVAGEVEAAFFSVKPSAIMSQWVGKAEQNLSELFAAAESCPLSVMFLDEIEALSPKRRSSGSTVMQRLVPQLLAEMDGFTKRKNPLLFIGATNEPWSIDSAVLRPGRLDRLIYVPPPDLPARLRILELNLTNAPLADELDLGQIAQITQNFSGADMASLARRVREAAFFEAIDTGIARQITQHDFENVLKNMHSSIDPKDLRKFERFADGEMS